MWIYKYAEQNYLLGTEYKIQLMQFKIWSDLVSHHKTLIVRGDEISYNMLYTLFSTSYHLTCVCKCLFHDAICELVR